MSYIPRKNLADDYVRKCRMEQRILVLFSMMIFSICTFFFILDSISSGETLRQAASNQQSYILKIGNVRGKIYDCNNSSFVSNQKKFIACVIPEVSALKPLSEVIDESNLEYVTEKFREKRPFKIEVLRKIQDENINVFETPIRNLGITLAPHVIGSISGDGHGVSGIERAYDNFLSCDNEAVSIKYNVDATNRLFYKNEKIVSDKSYLSTRGVSLNIDKRIQTIVSEVANRYISKGAVIVTEVPNCEVRAAMSLPEFLPQNISACLNDKNLPLLNRTMCSYNVGSVFKLMTCAAALESKISENFEYDCTGGCKVDDHTFRCYNEKSHGIQDMSSAIANSCNGYFIELSKKFSFEKLLDLCRKMDFDYEMEFAPGFVSSKGNLPTAEILGRPKELAAFSFGQGRLMATPFQVAGMINTFASDGIYSQPKIVRGLVDESLRLFNKPEYKKSEQVISPLNAKKIRDFMRNSLENGTSSRGKPTKTTACAKTSTAETGILIDGERVEQAWYAGFFPAEVPRYCVTILSEGSKGGQSIGPVFREIADKIYEKFCS